MLPIVVIVTVKSVLCSIILLLESAVYTKKPDAGKNDLGFLKPVTEKISVSPATKFAARVI